MPYRTVPLVTDYFYHVFNRGVEKRDIFLNKWDYSRFFKTLTYYQFSEAKPRFSRFNPEFYTIPDNAKKLIDIISYCLMPNHFHLLVKQIEDNGVSKYVGQVSNSYTKYFNAKNERVGPLFQGNFKAVLIENDEQFLHVSRYIHLNPYVAGLAKTIEDYEHSSLGDYLGLEDRQFVKKDYIFDLMKKDDYKTFIWDQKDYALQLEKIKHSIVQD